MLDQPALDARSIGDLEPVRSDSLLALIELAKADPRPEKIDVGVGVFRDSNGNTPILKVVKEAERRIIEAQDTKVYVSPPGDARFIAGITRVPNAATRMPPAVPAIATSERSLSSSRINRPRPAPSDIFTASSARRRS